MLPEAAAAMYLWFALLLMRIALGVYETRRDRAIERARLRHNDRLGQNPD